MFDDPIFTAFSYPIGIKLKQGPLVGFNVPFTSRSLPNVVVLPESVPRNILNLPARLPLFFTKRQRMAVLPGAKLLSTREVTSFPLLSVNFPSNLRFPTEIMFPEMVWVLVKYA